MLYFVIFILFIATLANAQWSSNPAVNTAISTATGSQMNPTIISDGSGGAIITWQDYRSGTEYDIYAQKINSSGVVQWAANGVAISTAGNDQNSPQLISDGSGGAIITWQDYRSGNNDDIYAQKINSSGVVQWTSNGVAICTATNFQEVPKLVSDGSGGAIITWQDYRSGTEYDIYAQKLNSSGAAQWTANGVAISTATSDQLYPQLISDGSGGAIIAWQDFRSGTDWDIYAQRVDADGTIHTGWTANGVAISTATSDQQYPQLISDGSGGAIITWRDFRGGSNFDIYSQKINSSGAVQWTANGVAICTATSQQDSPQIISDGSGGAIVTWYDFRSGNYDIYSQKINSSGAAQWTADGVAISTATNSQLSPQLISDGSNGAIITWRDLRGGTDWDIYAQRINSSGAVQWTANGVAISTATNSQLSPQLISDGSGGAIITWHDFRGGSAYDIYAQNVNSSGVIGNATSPTITTTSATSITNTTASTGGNVTSDGGATVTARGVIYGTSSSPELSASSTTTSNGTGTGSFASSLTSLTLQTLYYVKAYATNSIGTSYGSQVSFTTIPTLPEWGLIVMGLMIASFGGMYVWKRVV
jgi:hypothetical protein